MKGQQDRTSANWLASSGHLGKGGLERASWLALSDVFHWPVRRTHTQLPALLAGFRHTYAGVYSSQQEGLAVEWNK